MAQYGFFDIEDRYKSLTKFGDPLKKIKKLIDSKVFREILEEAFLKTLELGLSHLLSNIETTILPRERFNVMRCNDTREKEIKKDWTFSSINSLPG